MKLDQLKIKLENALQGLPQDPGIYQFFDAKGTIIYVGKAKNLKNRVRSYFQNQQNHNGKTRALVRNIFDLKYIIVESEQDALLLENTLIKEHWPKYNILLKDDKTYPWICVKKERFPRVFSTRKKRGTDGGCLGKFPNNHRLSLFFTIKERGANLNFFFLFTSICCIFIHKFVAYECKSRYKLD